MNTIYSNWEWVLSLFMLFVVMFLNASSDVINFKNKKPIKHSLNVAYVSVPAIMCAWDISEVTSFSIYSVLIWIFIFRWWEHDIYFNLRVSNKWWYIGETAFIDQAIRFFSYRAKFFSEGVRWQGVKIIFSIIFLTISYLIK